MPDLHPFIIETLASPRTTLKLHGASLPEDALVTEHKTKTSRTLYPGSRSATIQVIAVDHRPIKINGLLSDIETETPGYADDMRATLETLQSLAPRLLIIYRRTSATGIIKKTSFSEKDAQEIEYEIEFELEATGYEAPDDNVAQAYDPDQLEQMEVAFETAWNEADHAYTPPPDIIDWQWDDPEPEPLTKEEEKKKKKNLLEKAKDTLDKTRKKIRDTTAPLSDVAEKAKTAQRTMSTIKADLTNSTTPGLLTAQFMGAGPVLDCANEADNIAFTMGG